MRSSPHRDRAIELELAEAAGMADAVRAQRSLTPRQDTRVERIGDAWILYDGPHSPLSRCIGLGLTASADELEVPRIERFFDRYGADLQVDVCPFTDPRLVAALADRGCAPRGFRHLLVREVAVGPRKERNDASVIEIGPREFDEWSRVVALGFEDGREPGVFELGLTSRLRHAKSVRCFGAIRDGRIVAGGAVRIVDGIALLFAASTLPEHRGQGAQSDLIAVRLDHARDAGCRVAMLTATPGGGSHRNAERAGFRVEYTKFVMRSLARRRQRR